MTDFRAAARGYFDQHGWVTIPLVLDNNGLPKRPFSNGWQETPAEWPVIEALPWERALGIGVVLGPVSDNLAVIDIDSVPLSEAILSALTDAQANFYAVRTGRHRSHFYFREGLATSPQTFAQATWHGETFPLDDRGATSATSSPSRFSRNRSTTTSNPRPSHRWMCSSSM